MANNLAVKDASGTSRTIKTTDNSDVHTPHRIRDAPGVAWSYAAASGGILNTTTAVTIKAAHATLRNYITTIQLSSEALTTATEFAIRDGAGGTVLWRRKIGTAGILTGITCEFWPPLFSTAATLLEVVTLTASVAGAVYFNAQGYTAE